MDEKPEPLEMRLRRVLSEVCGALRSALSEALARTAPKYGSASNADDDASFRPAQLTSRLGINKSLAGRVVKAIEEPDEIRALLGIPTTQGLQLLQRAAEDVGVGGAAIQALEASSLSYARLLEEFSGGRVDLDAILVGFVPEERSRAERDGRRALFRGMINLVGTRASATYTAYFIFPSKDNPRRADTVSAAIRQDIRRLRTSITIPVIAVASEALKEKSQRVRRRLDNTPLEEMPASIILKEFSSDPLPKLEYHDDGRGLASIYFGPNTMDLNESKTLAFGWRTNDSFNRFAARTDFNCISITSPRPSEALIFDLMLHRDLEVEGTPFTTVTPKDVPHQPPPQVAPDASAIERQAAPEAVLLDDALSGHDSPYVRNSAGLVQYACESAGLSHTDFLKYRVTVEYPAAALEIRLWWMVPADPGTGRE